MTSTDKINEPPTGATTPGGQSPRPQGWHAALMSPSLSSRIAVGFAALCVVKLIMLVSLRKHLFEIHWRVSDENPNWLNSVAFYLFAALAGLNLWKLGTRCLPAGARLVRTVNATIL